MGPVKAEIVLRKRQRPNKVSLLAWHEVDSSGQPVGQAEIVGYTLEAKRRQGRPVGWIVAFTPDVMGDLFIWLAGRWRDRDGCGGMQRSEWTFHMSAGSSPRRND